MSESERGWDEGFAGHSLAQLRRLARLSLPEKLEWLEQAQRMVEEMNRSRAGEVRDAGREERS